MVFVDGENLCIRYENMVKEGWNPKPVVQHERGCFVWYRGLIFKWPMDVLRVSYYTTVACDDVALRELQDRIGELHWLRADQYGGRVVPRVFKKAEQGEKNKSVDVNICVDVLRHCYNGDVDSIVLVSGDGDYLPLIREVMRRGTQVYVSAFSKGMNPELLRTVDGFAYLDRNFFEGADPAEETEIATGPTA